MLRPLLALLLLANYLLLVGTGQLVARPEGPAFSVTHPYVHSKHCQQDNYLRLDCFEHCNDKPEAAQQKLTGDNLLHFMAQLKGLDVHCAFEQPRVPAAPGLRKVTARLARAGVAPVAAGFGISDYPPPRRG